MVVVLYKIVNYNNLIIGGLNNIVGFMDGVKC